MKALVSITAIIFYCGFFSANAQTDEPQYSIEGTLLCTSCDLKKAKGAATACSVYGCQFALKTEKVTDSNGNIQKQYEGKTYHILLNDQSKGLTHKDHKKKKFIVQGKIYDDEAVVEILSFAENE